MRDEWFERFCWREDVRSILTVLARILPFVALFCVAIGGIFLLLVSTG